MKLVIRSPKKLTQFINIFQFLKNCSENLVLMFQKEQIYIQGMDNSHICLYECILNQSWFDEYENNKSQNICFNSAYFDTILSTSTEYQDLFLYVDAGEEEPSQLNIDLINKADIKDPKNKSCSQYFKLNLLDINYDMMEINDSVTPYILEFTMEADVFSKIASKMLSFDSSVLFDCSDEGDRFHLLTSNTSIGDMKVDMSEVTEYSISEKEEMTVSFSLSYIYKMCLSTKISKQIEFYLSREAPMKMKYDLGDKSQLLFFMAPKTLDIDD
jgi:proliferating cell nuclear antigen PCNA